MASIQYIFVWALPYYFYVERGTWLESDELAVNKEETRAPKTAKFVLNEYFLLLAF